MSIVDTANEIANNFDGEENTRAQKRNLEREMRKQRRSQEEIDFALKQMDDLKKAKSIYKKAIEDLFELGFVISGQIIWHQSGCGIQINLTGLNYQQFQQIKNNKQQNNA